MIHKYVDRLYKGHFFNSLEMKVVVALYSVFYKKVCCDFLQTFNLCFESFVYSLFLFSFLCLNSEGGQNII